MADVGLQAPADPAPPAPQLQQPAQPEQHRPNLNWSHFMPDFFRKARRRYRGNCAQNKLLDGYTSILRGCKSPKILPNISKRY